VLIRSALRGDIAAVAKMVGQYWEFEGIGGFAASRTESLLQGLLASPERGACWIAETSGSLSGYLLAVFMFSLEHGGIMAEIDEVFVTPSMRSAGVGSLLLAAAQRDMKTRGVVRLQLQLAVGNQRARGFYERQGFSRRAGFELFDKPL
jgi:ribosomal protein S18 acetylase RimI-like enzyme